MSFTEPTLSPLVLIIAIACLLLISVIVCIIIRKSGYKKGQKDGYERRKNEAEAVIGGAEAEAEKIVAEAVKEGERKKRELMLAAKEAIHQSRTELEREIKEGRSENQRNERRLIQKEETLDKKIEANAQKEAELAVKSAEIQSVVEKTNALYEQQKTQLEKVSCMTREEAKEILLANVESELQHEKASRIREYQTSLEEDCKEKAREVISTAIQRCAADYVSEMTVSVVQLPDENMKGRIIGREGRNIRAIEQATGIDIIIDDTPEAVVLSGYDPVRREVARIAIESLISDGRIHPGKIEEAVEKARKEVDGVIKREGENATYETGVFGLHPEIVKLLGKLKYRTSYGQSVLIHSIEVSKLAGSMAEELGVDVALAKRAGLLHDIGKAVDYEQEGSHIEIGGEIAKRYKESPEIVNAIMAHHGDVAPETIVAVLVQAADAISAARPGARRESVETYIKRLEKLEAIANSFEGIDKDKTFVIQAGREIRVMVKPDMVSDDDMVVLSRDIAKQIEDNMEYPGQVKVTMIRECREVAVAK